MRANDGRHWRSFFDRSRGGPNDDRSPCAARLWRARLRAVLALMDEAVIGTTIGARKLVRYHARETIGCPRLMLTFSDARADIHSLYEAASAGVPAVSRDVAWLDRDGLIFRLPVSCFAVHDTLGHPYGFLEVVRHDGLSHRARLIALRQTVAQLAHEMSEPMTALAAYLYAGKLLLDRGRLRDLVKAEAASERALAELACAVDGLRRLLVSALRDGSTTNKESSWDYSRFPLCGCHQTATMKDGLPSLTVIAVLVCFISPWAGSRVNQSLIRFSNSAVALGPRECRVLGYFLAACDFRS